MYIIESTQILSDIGSQRTYSLLMILCLPGDGKVGRVPVIPEYTTSDSVFRGFLSTGVNFLW